MIGPPDFSQADWLAAYPPPRSLPLDQEALRIYEDAYEIGLRSEEPGEPPVTFTTVVLALFKSGDQTSRWLAAHAAEHGPSLQAIYAEKNIDPSTLPPPGTAGKPDTVRLSTDKQLLTLSARTVLENAEAWAHRVGGSDIGVRHLVASYVLNPPAVHRRQLQRWGFEDSKWRAPFFAWVAEHYTAEDWLAASQRPAPTKPLPSFAQPSVSANDIAFPGSPKTLAILEDAAAHHARRSRPDPWLRYQTLLYTVMEAVDKDPELQSEIAPLWHAIQAVPVQYSSANGEYFSETPTRPELPFTSLNISSRVLNALETARELAVATKHDADGDVRVSPLQLVGALVSRRVNNDSRLVALGLDPQAIRLQLIEYAGKRGQSVEVWREQLGEEETLEAGRPIDLNSDEPEAVVRLDEKWVNDPLLIRPDVEAFAALLASKDLEPPLSIGLFGPWGSGKTTFIKRLRRVVDRRADEARKAIEAGQPTPYVGNVVHVDFNAWHFAEGALASSLVDTILRELGKYIKNQEVMSELGWRKATLDSLESARRSVEAAKAIEVAARAAVKKSEAALETARKKAAERATGLRAALDAVWTATRESLRSSAVVKESGVLEAVGDSVQSAAELQNRLNAVRSRPARLLSELGWVRSIVFAVLVLGVPPAVAWLAARLLKLGDPGQFLSSLAAIISVLGLWARSATGAVAKVDRAITEITEEYGRRVAEDKGVQDAQEDLEKARATEAGAAKRLQTAQDDLARAQSDAANATLPAQMLQLVSGRLDDRSYTKELTTISLARADLQALSTLLRGQRAEAASGGQPASDPGTGSTSSLRAVDRVILYIDDLDRCSPGEVVRVLQLVHMLLAFELFVVVVAVDSRWVEQALVQVYPWLGDGQRRTEGAGANGDREPVQNLVTPQDYLEKIFQISFWLEPMSSPRAARYLASLVRTSVPEASSAPSGESESEETGTGQPSAGRPIDIDSIELSYMQALAAYVGPSPRRVKRLVNAYRLIKARLSDAQLEKFVTVRSDDEQGYRSGPYQLVIALLVIGTGAPFTSAEILRTLAEWDPGSKLEEVVDELRQRNHPDWTMAAQVIEMVMGTQKAKDVSELRGWARKVRRFLLTSHAGEFHRIEETAGAPPASVS